MKPILLIIFTLRAVIYWTVKTPKTTDLVVNKNIATITNYFEKDLYTTALKNGWIAKSLLERVAMSENKEIKTKFYHFILLEKSESDADTNVYIFYASNQNNKQLPKLNIVTKFDNLRCSSFVKEIENDLNNDALVQRLDINSEAAKLLLENKDRK